MSSLIKNYNFQKPLSACLLLVLIANLIIGGVLLPYKTAQAIPVNVTSDVVAWLVAAKDWVYKAWDKVQNTLQSGYQATLAALGISKEVQDAIEKALKWVFTAFKKRLLDMMTDDIVKWIGGGGKPRFVTDWQGFLKTAADRAAGQFITQKLGAGFLCGPFAIKLQIALAKPPTFDEAVTCTLSTITKNIDNFFNDFSQGGWKGWLTVSEPQNNIFGADLMAIDQKYDLVAKAQEAAKNEAAAGSGYLDSKVCTKRQCPNRLTGQPGPIENFSGGAAAGGWKQDELDQGDGYFCECLNWTTRSPGKIAADLLSKVAGKDWDWLLQSKEYGEYLFAIADAVINRIIKEGVLAIKSMGSSSDSTGISMSASAASVDLSVYADAAKNNTAAATLIPQEKLLKENLNKNLSEYQKNLDILNQAKATQENTIRLLQQTLSAGCSLPTGSSVGTETSVIQGNCNTTTCPCETVTTKTQPFTISALGSGTLQQIITNRYSQEEGAWPGPATTCASLTYSATQSSIINSTLSSSAQIAALQLEMQALQEKISQVDTVIADSTDYQKASQAYIDAYDQALNISGIPTNATTTEAAMLAAKTKALVSVKALTQNPSDELTGQLDTVMQLSQDTAQKNSDLQAQRGYSTDCSYVESGTYQADLCAAKAKESETQNNLTACTAIRY